MTGNGSDRVRFGPYEVDLHTCELWKYGTRIRLVGQPFEILAMLMSRPGQLVTRDELRERLWPSDTFVDFDHGLNAAVNKLREALSDSAEAPKYVETLPRRGYRFIAPVEPASTQAVPVVTTTASIPEIPRVKQAEPFLALADAYPRSGSAASDGLPPRRRPWRTFVSVAIFLVVL